MESEPNKLAQKILAVMISAFLRKESLIHFLEFMVSNLDWGNWSGEIRFLVGSWKSKLTQEMAELKDAIGGKAQISKSMTLLRLRERMTESMELNRLGNRPYAYLCELLHQVSKKRQNGQFESWWRNLSLNFPIDALVGSHSLRAFQRCFQMIQSFDFGDF